MALWLSVTVFPWLVTTILIESTWLHGYMASSQRLSVGVSFPPELLEEIDDVNDKSSRSEFIQDAVREYIDAENNE